MGDLVPAVKDELELAVERADKSPLFPLPVTGEVISLKDPAQIAYGLSELRESKRLLEDVRSLLVALLRVESKRQGTKTLRLGEFEVTITGGSKSSWDPETLIRELSAAGLPPERLEEAVPIVCEYKPSWKVLRQLAAANFAYEKAIREARSTEPAPWNATIKKGARE